MDMNSVTSGDVMLYLLLFIVAAVSVWALLVASALIFGRRAEYAQDYFELAPWRTFIIGLLFGGAGNFLGIALLSAAPPLIKLFGWFILATMWSFSVIGASGLARLAANRISDMESGSAGFGALAKGAGLVVLAGMVPLLGWLLIIPVLTIVSFGAGIQSILFGAAVATRRASVSYPTEGIR